MQIKRSESLVNLSKKLIQIQQNGVKVAKDAKNPFYKSLYMTLDSVLESVIPLCNEVGISVTQVPTMDSLNTLIVDSESGEWLESDVSLNINNKNPQEIGSAISYFRRYSLCSIFNIINAVDDDGNTASGKVVSNPPANSAPKPVGNIAPSSDVKWVNSETDLNFIAASKAIESGEIKTKEQLLKEFAFNPNKIGAVSSRKKLEAKLS